MLFVFVGVGMHALIAFFMFMTYTRVRFHNKNTHLADVKRIAFCIIFTYLVGFGFLGNQWDIAIIGMIGAFNGVMLGLLERGDLAYYRSLHREWTELLQNHSGPEDDPNWPEYRSRP